MAAGRPREGVLRDPGFRAFWAAETVSGFGSYVTSIALQVVVVVTLHGTATDVGLLNAARWLPYLLFGLVAGALVDRRRRQPVLVLTDLGSAALLALIPLLELVGWLSLPALMGIVAAFGVCALASDAASQSFLPRLVPSSSLLPANARLDQSGAVAQTSGPVVGGALVAMLGAPVAVLVDAASYLFSAATIARIRVVEPAAGGTPRDSLRREVGEGVRWMYRHPTLAPLAVSTHAWFLFNSVVTTIVVPFVLLRLRTSAFGLGVALACSGVAGFAGSLAATRIGLRWGAGRTVTACRAAAPVAWAVIAAVPVGQTGAAHWLAIGWVSAGQALYGLALGVENANEMSYWQSLTPDALQGRVNSTRRSINRAMVVVGAPIGGLVADRLGYRPTFWIAVAGFVLAPTILVASPFRRARHGD